MAQIVLKVDEKKKGVFLELEEVDPVFTVEALLSTGLGLSKDVGLPWESMIICNIMQQSQLSNEEILEIVEEEMREHRSQKEE